MQNVQNGHGWDIKGEYANKNEREFFAECFAEYLMSARPREAAKIFGEVLEKIMEGLR